MIQYLDEIQEHFKENYPREGCGILGVVKGKLKWFPCENVAEDDDDFIMNSSQYLDISRKCDITGIVHSHPDASCEPSQLDIDTSNAIGIPYHIFSYPEMELYTLKPKKLEVPLYGRSYEFGKYDCFEAARDYYKSIGWDSISPRALFEDDWWEKDLDYFTEEVIKNWNFKKVEGNLEPNDFLVFRIWAPVNNHCGVYLGDDIFYHHAINRLSCRENLYPRWKKHITGVYRYVA